MSETITEPTGSQPPSPPPKASFTPEYVQELREEAKTWRLKAQGHEVAARTAKEAADAAKREAESAVIAASEKAQREADEKISAAQSAANARIIRAELRAAAIKAGMVDLDALKLLDMGAVKITESGDVEGADALIEAAKAAKPYLFGGGSTSNTNPPPPPKQQVKKSAVEMSDEEFNAAMKARAWRK